MIAVPADAVDDAIQRATDKVSRENSTRAELMAGSHLRDVYEKYGVL